MTFLDLDNNSMLAISYPGGSPFTWMYAKTWAWLLGLGLGSFQDMIVGLISLEIW